MDDNNHIHDWFHAIAVSPDFIRDGMAYAAKQTGLLFTTNGGRIWRPAFNPIAQLEYPSVTAVCLSPNFPSDQTLWSAIPGAILRSQDGASSWQFSKLSEPEPVITCLAASPDYPHDLTVFAGTMDDGLFISSDGGASWYPWNFGLIESGIQSIVVSPGFRNDEMVFLATETGLYRSSNGGRSWKNLLFPITETKFNCLALSPDFQHDNILFAGTEIGLFISDNQGDSWHLLAENILGGPIDIILSRQIEQGRFIILIVGADRALYYSIDVGQSWKRANPAISQEQSVDSLEFTICTSSSFSLLIGLSDGQIIPVTCQL